MFNIDPLTFYRHLYKTLYYLHVGKYCSYQLMDNNMYEILSLKYTSSMNSEGIKFHLILLEQEIQVKMLVLLLSVCKL